MSAELSTQVVITIIFGLLQVLIGLVTIWQLRDRRQPNSEYAMSSVKAEY
jgi:heme A synthase